MVVIGWLFKRAFKDFKLFDTQGAEVSPSQDAIPLYLKLPVAPLISALQVFTDRAQLTTRYPCGDSNQLRFTLEEEGAITDCCVKTLVLDDAPLPVPPFLAPSERPNSFRPKNVEAWFIALSEFNDLDAPDVELQITLRDHGEDDPAAVLLQVKTISGQAEVELPRCALEQLEVNANGASEVKYSYLLSSVLASCLKPAKEARAVKVRFNEQGVMSNQYILKSRTSKDTFLDAFVSPMALKGPAGVRARASQNPYLTSNAALLAGLTQPPSTGF